MCVVCVCVVLCGFRVEEYARMALENADFQTENEQLKEELSKLKEKHKNLNRDYLKKMAEISVLKQV